MVVSVPCLVLTSARTCDRATRTLRRRPSAILIAATMFSIFGAGEGFSGKEASTRTRGIPRRVSLGHEALILGLIPGHVGRLGLHVVVLTVMPWVETHIAWPKAFRMAFEADARVLVRLPFHAKGPVGRRSDLSTPSTAVREHLGHRDLHSGFQLYLSQRPM
jgi:hypothetical protein